MLVSPRVDVYENNDAWLIMADVPGVSKEAVELSVKNNTLHLSAKGENLHYQRSWVLPSGHDGEQVTADLKNGVLSVQIQKQLRQRKVPIATA